MKKQFMIILILLASVQISYGQQGTSKKGQKSVRYSCRKPILHPKKPAIFITFLRKEVIKSNDRLEDSNLLFFKLNNNTCWPIVLDMSGVLDNRFGDARLYYLIENRNRDREPIGSLFCHVCSVNSIGSGRSIVFSVPLRYADREATMRVRYKFKWEDAAMIGDYESSNTMHTVAYSFIGLPETVLPKTLVPNDSVTTRP